MVNPEKKNDLSKGNQKKVGITLIDNQVVILDEPLLI
jgi:ABC-type uncharacterized transport system ATPase subunit